MASVPARQRLPNHASSPKIAERRFGLALVCSGAVHFILILSAARFVGSVPIAGPLAGGESAPLQAVLQAPEAPIPAVDLLPLPPLPAELTTPVMAEPPPETVAAASTAATAPSPSAFGAAPANAPIVSSDQSGRITYSIVFDPTLVNGAVARRLAERYPSTPYKRPNVQGSLSVAYPADARQKHTSARIAAVLDLDERGGVTGITLVPNEEVFGPAVLAALKDARLSPAHTTSGPVPYWAIVEFVFAISPAPAGTPQASPPATATN